MILSFNLGTEIQCEKLCQEISKVVTKISQSGVDISNCQLVIDIKTVVDDTESMIPKLEYTVL